MTFKNYSEAVLTTDIPDQGLCKGDVVKIVDSHCPAGQETGYSIEVFNALGNTIAVTAVPASSLAPLEEDEVLSVRRLVKSV